MSAIVMILSKSPEEPSRILKEKLNVKEPLSMRDVQLNRSGSSSAIRITIPHTVVEKYNLKPGDKVFVAWAIVESTP